MGVNVDALDNKVDQYVRDVTFIKYQLSVRSRSLFHRSDLIFNKAPGADV